MLLYNCKIHVDSFYTFQNASNIYSMYMCVHTHTYTSTLNSEENSTILESSVNTFPVGSIFRKNKNDFK